MIEKLRGLVGRAERLMDEVSKASARRGESAQQAFARLVAERDPRIMDLAAAHDEATRALTRH